MDSTVEHESPFPEGDILDSSSKQKSFKIEDDPVTLTDDDGWLDILGSGDLKKKVIKPGIGLDSRPQRNNWVTLNLTEKISGNDEIIESYQNFRFILGDCEVVQGLDVSLALMEKGEIADIIVSPRLAYGSIGKLPNIPPDSCLHYQVELVDVEDTIEETNLPYEERIKIGDSKRERGNFWYSRGDYSSSIHCYRRALEFLDEQEEILDKDMDKVETLLQLRLRVYNNLTAAQMKMEAYDAALKSVDFVLKAEPDNVKALFRKGKILGSKGNTGEAITFLRKALTLEPETKIIHQELSKLLNKRKMDVQAEKAMYRKMFSQDDRDKNESRNCLTSNTKLRLQRFGLLITSVLVVALGIVLYNKHSAQ